MKKIISNKDRKYFYVLSLWIVISFAAMFGLSLTASVLNYEISKYVNEGSLQKEISLILTTIHTALIIFNWIAIKVQKSKIDYVKSSKFAQVIGIVMDGLSTVSMVCNVVTALINGNVLSTDKTWVLPFMSFITFAISNINLAFAIYFLVVAKKAMILKQTV